MSNKVRNRAPKFKPQTPQTQKFNYAEWAEQRQTEGTVEVFYADDKDPIVIPAPEFWPDALVGSLESQWRSIVGDEAFDRFRLDTGHGAKALDAAFATAQGLTAGE